VVRENQAYSLESQNSCLTELRNEPSFLKIRPLLAKNPVPHQNATGVNSQTLLRIAGRLWHCINKRINKENISLIVRSGESTSYAGLSYQPRMWQQKSVPRVNWLYQERRRGKQRRVTGNKKDREGKRSKFSKLRGKERQCKAVKTKLSLGLIKHHSLGAPGEWSYASPFLTSGIDGGECSDSRPYRFNPGVKPSDTHHIRGSVGFRVCLDVRKNRKFSCPYRESNPRFLSC
jgi:hypothetical protein